jgi:hypothetical protein
MEHELDRLLRDFAWDRMDRVYAALLTGTAPTVSAQRPARSEPATA